MIWFSGISHHLQKEKSLLFRKPAVPRIERHIYLHLLCSNLHQRTKVVFLVKWLHAAPLQDPSQCNNFFLFRSCLHTKLSFLSGVMSKYCDQSPVLEWTTVNKEGQLNENKGNEISGCPVYISIQKTQQNTITASTLVMMPNFSRVLRVIGYFIVVHQESLYVFLWGQCLGLCIA